MGLFSRKSDPTPSPTQPIEVKWSFEGSGNAHVDRFGSDDPDSLNERDMAEMVAKRHSLNWGSADRTRGISIKGWRKA